MTNNIDIIEYYFNKNRKYTFLFDKEMTLAAILNEDDLVFNSDIEKYLLNFFTHDELYFLLKGWKIIKWDDFNNWLDYIDNYK